MARRQRGHRAFFHDYCAPGYYLITATAVEGDYAMRLLSSMTDVTSERLNHECMIIPNLTDLGIMVKKEIEYIPIYHPKLEVKRYVIMPDHIHMVIHAKERLAKKLGSELAGFFGGCTRRLRDIVGIVNSDIKLFQPFHDQIIFDFNQLNRSIRYVEDNPRRYIIKKMHPHLFKRHLHVLIGEQEYGVMGNLFLLKEIHLLPVRIHRRWTEEEFDAYEKKCAKAIDEGAVVISPAIHRRERDILNMAISAGGSVIKLTDRPITERSKPQGKLFDLCAEGRLLILAPWQSEGGKKHVGYTEFHNMNDMAQQIATLPADTRMQIR